MVETFDFAEYFLSRDHFPFTSIIIKGLSGWRKRSVLMTAEGVDALYRERDPDYMRMAGDFIDKFREYDLIVMGMFNYIHPELLCRELKKPIKILGFIDDPHVTYKNTLSYLWAFDGAFYTSPSYIDHMLFSSMFARWGGGVSKPSYWYPLTVPFKTPETIDDTFFRNRNLTAAYVGAYYGSKVNRLIDLKRRLRDRFSVYGRWPLRGYSGFVRALFGRPIFPYRVKALTDKDRRDIYWQTKIGFNMHISGDGQSECGNVRTYEVPAHGMLLVSDKGAADGHAQIFEPDKEALYYDSVNEAVDIIEYYDAHDNERIAIAKAGFERFWRDYRWEDNIVKFFDWALSLRKNV
jgi:hypothetical protein